MKNCLTTKLKGIVSNDILKVGEARVQVAHIDNPTESSQQITIRSIEKTSVSIIGEGNFTDSSLSENRGKQIQIDSNSNSLYITNSNVKLSISNKYNLTFLRINERNSIILPWKINIKDYEFSTNMTSIIAPSTLTYGDIFYLRNLSELTSLYLSKTLVTGDISDISNLTKITLLGLSNTNVKGSLKSISKMTSLISLYLSDADIEGDFSNLQNLVNIQELWLSNTKIKGDISSFQSLKNLRVLNLNYNTDCTGDLGTLPDSLYIIYNVRGYSNLTWSSSNRTHILSMIDIKCDNIDKLLIDMSSMEARPEDNYKSLALIGFRSSASDSAIAMLQQKGYTVSISSNI